MSRAERLKIIKKLEGLLESPVLTYITGDRHPAIRAAIADDAVRILYRHLGLITNLSLPLNLNLRALQ